MPALTDADAAATADVDVVTATAATTGVVTPTPASSPTLRLLASAPRQLSCTAPPLCGLSTAIFAHHGPLIRMNAFKMYKDFQIDHAKSYFPIPKISLLAPLVGYFLKIHAFHLYL
uniref:Uncharacterized protein n=1 Tax=Bactrocera latifrons TaxID=174628 RepID=A0A0K8V570_BACLA